MNPRLKNRPSHGHHQEGVSLLVVLVLLTVLLLGGLTMARVDADASLIAGNTAYREAALQASEIGLSDGFAQVAALASVDADNPAAGYFATRRAESGGLPIGFDWSTMPSTEVGPYTVRRVVERLCNGPPPVVDPRRQCVVHAVPSGLEQSAKPDADIFDTAVGTQYRVTVSVVGPKNTQVFVQDAVTR